MSAQDRPRKSSAQRTTRTSQRNISRGPAIDPGSIIKPLLLLAIIIVLIIIVRLIKPAKEQVPETTEPVTVEEVVETEPVDVPPEFAAMKFMNQVAVFETALSAREFSKRMHAVEDSLGRIRTVRNGPRTIDIDLVDFGGMVSDDPELTLPHPRARMRDFVMGPLAELGLADCLDCPSGSGAVNTPGKER